MVEYCEPPAEIDSDEATVSQSGTSVAVPAPVAVMVGTAVSGAPGLVQRAPVSEPAAVSVTKAWPIVI